MFALRPRCSTRLPMACRGPFGMETLRSKSQLRAHFPSGPGRMQGVTEFAAADRIVHLTDDPEVVVAEFRYVGRAHDRPFAIPCIFVLRVRDGYIVESRDYADHLGFARASGRLPEFAAQLVAREAGPAAG
jgi:ketosteroid isomerase-like protein